MRLRDRLADYLRRAAHRLDGVEVVLIPSEITAALRMSDSRSLHVSMAVVAPGEVRAVWVQRGPEGAQ